MRAVLAQWEKNNARRKQQRHGGEIQNNGLKSEADSLSVLTHGLEGSESATAFGGAGDLSSATFLGHTLERFLQELDHELSMKTFKVTEVMFTK